MQQENQKVSEFDQEVPWPHTTDQPMAQTENERREI